MEIPMTFDNLILVKTTIILTSPPKKFLSISQFYLEGALT